jgi:hypothetical protein
MNIKKKLFYNIKKIFQLLSIKNLFYYFSFIYNDIFAKSFKG